MDGIVRKLWLFTSCYTPQQLMCIMYSHSLCRHSFLWAGCEMSEHSGARGICRYWGRPEKG